jgi:hypothetical protein
MHRRRHGGRSTVILLADRRGASSYRGALGGRFRNLLNPLRIG